MHEAVKNEKKEKSGSNKRARLLQQQQQHQIPRTGPTALISDNEVTLQHKKKGQPQEDDEQQKRIAARAANAMAQVLRRRREPRSLMMWGDRKKVTLKRYPDGSQELIVPQTLTPEQENYEFPPRSRFLKKLATSTAEHRRLSILQNNQQPENITTAATVLSSLPHSAPTDTPSSTMIQPDQLTLKEWFSPSNINRNQQHTISGRRNTKDRAVIDWMNDVERHSKTVLRQQQHTMHKPSPTPSSCYSHKIQFKSDAGKRWANSITSNTSLLPPDDTCRKHYVPRRLLISSIKKNNENNLPGLDDADAATNKIRLIWKEYQSKSTNNQNNQLLEKKVGITAMQSTGQRTPVAGLVQLLQTLHQSYKEQQKVSHDRIEKFELLLKQEMKKRERAEENIRKLELDYKHRQGQQATDTKDKRMHRSLISRATQLEQSVKREGNSRKLSHYLNLK